MFSGKGDWFGHPKYYLQAHFYQWSSAFVLGFVAAWRHDFGSKDASTLNRMVLQYAVPLALFTGTVMTSREALSQDIPLVITLCVAHHWLLLCGVSVFPTSSSYASEQ